MSGQCVIGVDIGTQGTKASLYTSEGVCLASSFHPSKLHRPREGTVEEDPEKQVTSVCLTVKACIKEARANARNVAALAVDGQMAGIIGIGNDGRAITPYDSWLDTRCAPFITLMRDKSGTEIIRKTGGQAGFNHGPKILWWKKERAAVYRRIRAFVQPGGYAALRLCGHDARTAFIDTTYLHFSGFADNRRSRWDESLCRTFGVDPEKLPCIVRPREIVGEVSLAMSSRCGLRPGTPVAAGCGDSAASFLACGATREGISVDVAGTASVFAATTRTFLADEKRLLLSCGQSAVPGLWHPYAYINGGGMNLEWFRKDIRDGVSLESLDRAAAAIAPSDNLPIFIPHLGGRPDLPHLRGAWTNLTWSHAPAHLYRAMLEGVAFEYRLYRDAMKSCDRAANVTEIRVTGGGASSRTWNAIKAGILNCPVVQMKRDGGAPMGAALLAAHAVGLVGDLDAEAQSWAQRGDSVRPSRSGRALNTRRFELYRRLLDQLGTPTNL